jgi:hypothetical protein
MIRSLRRLALVCGGGVVVLAAFALGYAGVGGKIVGAWSSRSAATGYVPSARRNSGPEIALIYIGASACAACNRSDLPAAVESAKVALRKHAVDRLQAFSAVGIAKDHSIEAGIAHLRKFGRFDEVMTGRGWLNAGVLRYVYGAVPGPAATPQLLVVERVVHVEEGDLTIDDRALLLRKVGALEILAWVAAGAPLPPVDAASGTGTVQAPARSRLVLPDGAVFTLDIARTTAERQRGLTGRSALGPNEGLVNVYATPTEARTWTKGYAFSIDALWLDASRLILDVAQDLKPCIEEPCPKRSPKAPYQYYIELPAGTLRRHPVKPGDVVQLQDVQ